MSCSMHSHYTSREQASEVGRWSCLPSGALHTEVDDIVMMNFGLSDDPPSITLFGVPVGLEALRWFQSEKLGHFASFYQPHLHMVLHLRIPRISATQSTGMLPSTLRHDCHPRSVATLDRMISLGSLLLSMVVALAVRFFAVLPPGQQLRSQPMRRAPRQLDNAASRWSRGATRRWACQIYTDAALANVACRLRMESPFKAIL